MEKPFAFPELVSEYTWDDNPPFFLSLNTNKRASAGNYQVLITLTYGKETAPQQDSMSVEFHIQSRWERLELPLAITGAVIALLALIVTAVGTIWQMLR